MHTQPDIHIPQPTAVKEYIAIINQTGTNAPTATVFKNTIGNIIWTRTNAGNYSAELTGAFTPGKTIVLPFGSQANGALFQILSGATIGYLQITSGTDPDRVAIATYSDLAYSNVEWSTIGGDFSLHIQVFK